MKTFKKHHTDELPDGIKGKGSWRPSLVSTLDGADGMPIAWKEIVVVSCPQCAGQFGVGADGPEINANGKTDEPVHCPYCSWSDHMEFEKHQHSEGREHFAKLKGKAEESVRQARLDKAHQIIQKQMQDELNDRAYEEAKKLFPAGGNHPEILRDFLKKNGKTIQP